MKNRQTYRAALGVALLSLCAPMAFAATASPAPSAFALPAGTLALVVTPVLEGATPAMSVLHAPGVPEVSLAGVHYRPRRSGVGRRVDASSVSQIHLGFFDPDGDPARKFLVGIRGGPMLDSHVQLGVGLDWAHDSDNISSVSSTSTGPGGTPISVQRDLARASTDLFPIMGFIQISADDNMGVVPYFGGAAGFQLLSLSADDFLTGDSFDATYGGWGWQLWGGAALPLSGRTRLAGEIFINGAELSRDVDDPYYGPFGSSYRETVKADGVGARFGLAWGF